MSVRCPCCGQLTTEENGPIERDLDGIPLALSLRHGLKLPVVDQANYRVFVDGKETSGAVAFDRRSGEVWLHKNEVRGGELVIEKKTGEVRVEPVE